MFTPRTAFLFKQISLFLLAIQSAPLFACADDEYEWNDMCLKKIGGAVGQLAESVKNTQLCKALNIPCIDIAKEAERVAREIQAQGNAPLLAAWIQQSRNDARNSGTSPIPEKIKQQLNGFYRPQVLNGTVYKIGDNGLLNLGQLATVVGDAEAITLIDVIVFKSPDDINNLSLWVHELMHAEQYFSWGVYNFAIRYLRDPEHYRNPVENEARKAERDFFEKQKYSQQKYSQGRLLEVWEVKEGAINYEWSGTWTRRGDSNTFDCEQHLSNGISLTATIAVTKDNNHIYAEKRNVSDRNDCNYEGTRTGNEVSGTYHCNNGGPFRWYAKIFD